jgi:CDP-glucose 4,6-dehydratase
VLRRRRDQYKCYLNDESGRPFTETDPLGGHDPYSACKAAQELVTQSYRLSFFDPAAETAVDHPVLRLASGRAGNVIGGGDWTPDGLVADVARARREVIVLRSPAAVRPWQHVLEPLSGYLTPRWTAGRVGRRHSRDPPTTSGHTP